MNPQRVARSIVTVLWSSWVTCLAAPAWAQTRPAQEVAHEQRVTVRPTDAPPTDSAFGGPFVRVRIGPGLEVNHSALGGWLGAMFGWENRHGLGVAVSLGARYHTASDYTVSDFAVGALFRVSALPRSRFHPFGEIGPALHVTVESGGPWGGSSVVFGGDAGLGLQVDLSRRLSLDFAGRGEILVRSQGAVQVVLTPMVGVELRL